MTQKEILDIIVAIGTLLAAVFAGISALIAAKDLSKNNLNSFSL